MAYLLSRIGRAAFRHRRLVALIWLVIFAGFGVGAATMSGSTSGAFTMPGTESQRAIDLLSDRLPAANGASGRIVFAAPEGETLSGASRAAVQDAVAQIAAVPGVQEAGDPFADGLVSPDGRIALAQVGFEDTGEELDDATRVAVHRAADTAEDAGVQVELGGDAVVDSDESGLTEFIGLPVAALVLLLTFGSLIAAGLPLLTAIVGVATGLAGITAATAVFDLSDEAPTIALMLGLAVGIDYAVFIVSRHRSQLASGMPLEDSAARAIATAGTAVVFAGATVVIALAALSVVGIPFITGMGLAAAATVVIAVAVALTLVPAMLGFAGTRIAGRRRSGPSAQQIDEASSDAGRRTLGARWARLVTRHRVVAALVTTVLLGACALPVFGLRLGLPDDSTASPSATNRQAYDLLAEGFGPGFNGPLTLVVAGGAGDDVADSAAAVASGIDDVDGVANVGRPVLNPAGDTAVISLTPESGPSTDATKQLVHDVRDRAEVLEHDVDAQVLVTGQTAVNIDVSERLADALIPFLAVIVGLAFVLLVIAFRSILVPLTAVAGFLLSIGAALGALVGIFQNGFAADLFGLEPAPIMSLLPIIAIGILFGLAMDYQVFLVSRMREEHVHGAGPIRSVTEGFRHGARVVTAAALIMGAVFAGFMLESGLIKSVGFALAFGILVDAFVVRMTLIPAVMAVLGERAWWLPRWLDRLLPRVDLEGAALDEPTPAVVGAGDAGDAEPVPQH
ncbi:putative drug exporter of the RND superfamily [Nocardioides terrae]|uniref:Putative drug exporter of the RND superfamily n=1 Tax=Nocardioides terrae TaxID=574651 RepID=A0A1I1DE29_9ACTN|nr:MMPL family transporter [Nocardioides terrae]SFB72642.1 putative drug exporter of the RND superfamily [Nocardioides terrae]